MLLEKVNGNDHTWRKFREPKLVDELMKVIEPVNSKIDEDNSYNEDFENDDE